MNRRSLNAFSLLFITALLISCIQSGQKVSEDIVSRVTEPEMKFQNRAHELVYQMTQKVGDIEKLKSKKDVAYTYTYNTPDGQIDVAEERYIFDGEKSYALYTRHDRTLKALEGSFEQGYDGQNFWLRHKGEYIDDEQMMKRVIFNRKTNFYWFTMMQKLTDRGLTYEYVKEALTEGSAYDVVKVTFDSDNGKPTDIYQLWINKETHLVDQFLFTVVDFRSIDEPNLMKLEYESMEDMMIPTKRKYTKANWEGENLTDLWILVDWSNISFDNGLKNELFERK